MSTPSVKIKNIPAAPRLDVDEFNALTDLLYESLNGNISAICRLLDINRRTWKKWEKTPPTWPYWNLVLRHVIKHTLIGMVGRHRSPAAKHKQYVREALARIPRSDEFVTEIENAAYQLSAAQTDLRRFLIRGPQPWHKIRVSLNYNPRTLQSAGRALGVVKEQMGFGEDKISVWRLPTEDD